MGLLAQYGSDSEDSDVESSPAAPIASSSSHTAKPLPTPVIKPASAPPTAVPSKLKGKKALVIGSNSALLTKLGVRGLEDENEDGTSGSAKKKAKLNNGTASADTIQREGKGKSSLVDMLPPPKRALPKPPAKPAPLPGSSSSGAAEGGTSGLNGTKEKNPYLSNDGTMLPRVVGKGGAKAKAQEVEPEVDFFGIAVEPEASSSRLPPVASTSISSPFSISSAPAAPDFIPPAPSPSDPYPGYYPLPSGQWAAHDPAIYSAFLAEQQKDAAPTSGKGGNVDRMWDTSLDVESMQSVDVMGQLNEEKRLVEERKRFTAPDLFSEESTYKAVGKTTGRAGQRHQLSALLKDAHSNRAELEERIAANKRTKKDSGAKYGF